MVTRFYIPRYSKEYRLLSRTVSWLGNKPDAAEAIDQLVANAEAAEKNPPLAARHGNSEADEELQICYEQIETLKQLLKHQIQISEEYLKEIEHCNQEMATLQEELCNRDQIILLIHHRLN